MGSWLEGKTLAKKIKEKVKNDVALYLKQKKEVPGLAAILVGENRASKIYLRTKERNCERLGIHSEILCLPEGIEASLLKAKIEELNSREDVDSILVQLPLPSSFNAPEIIASIHPEKDVDGVHPFNLGKLMMNQEGLKPCTPLGIIELLKSREIPIAGKRVVIIGRSRLVGKPLAAMVTNENGTVTICHSKTENLPQVSSEADILVGAIGRGAFITPEFVKQGAVVVDVGMNNLTDKSKVEQMFGQDEKRLKDLRDKGYTLIGDVHPQVVDKAEFLTPVPGGV